MNYLLDTHALIWFIKGDQRLSTRAKTLIEDEANPTYFSVVSSFELAIKINIGKLQLSQSLVSFLHDAVENNLLVLPLKDDYLTHYTYLPLFPDHRDPFDRMLIATAIAESLTIITADDKFDLYKNLIKVEW